MKRFLKLGIISIILGMLASFLLVGPASAADFDVKVGSISAYGGSTGQQVPVTVQMPAFKGLGGFDIVLQGGAAGVGVWCVVITNVVVNPNFIGAVNIDRTQNLAHFTGVWNGYPAAAPGGLTTVATVFFDTKAGGVRSIDPTFASITDEIGTLTNRVWPHANLISCDVTIVVQPAPTTTIKAGLSPTAAINIGITPPISAVAPAVGATSFLARISATNGADIEVQRAQGLTGWSATYLPGMTPPWMTNCQVTGSRATPSVGGDVASIKIRLVGPAAELSTVTLDWQNMVGMDENGGNSQINPTDPAASLLFRRGDVDKSGSVNIADTTKAELYLVGLQTLTAEPLVNLACVVHDSNVNFGGTIGVVDGDIISAADVLRLLQYNALLTDNYFNLN